MVDLRTDSQMPWAVRMLLKAGVPNRKQAEGILLIFAVLCIVFTTLALMPEKKQFPLNDPQQNPNYEPTKTQ